MRVNLPLALEAFPDPPDRPTVADLLDLQRNPAFLLIVARLQRLAYQERRRSDKDKSDEIWIQKAREALGVERALEEMNKVLNPVGSTEEE